MVGGETVVEAIRADEVLTKQEFMRRARVGKHGYESATKKGLTVRRHGNRAYIVGADWIAFLAGHPAGVR